MIFIHKATNMVYPKMSEVIEKVAKLVEEYGIDVWFDDDKVNAHSLQLDEPDNYQKVSDTLDVWFDSGVTHYTVLKQSSLFPADLYLEGSDQHRGWFQSSLLTSCAINNCAPYKQLLTHGFVVDEQGRKMSKSLGNIISIEFLVKKYGADIVRLWVASVDYTTDLAYSDEFMKRVVDNYRRIRNTLRFLFANTSDFNQSDLIDTSDLCEFDQFALYKLGKFQKLIMQFYVDYNFHLIVKETVNFCSEFLGDYILIYLKIGYTLCQKHRRLGVLVKLLCTTY